MCERCRPIKREANKRILALRYSEPKPKHAALPIHCTPIMREFQRKFAKGLIRYNKRLLLKGTRIDLRDQIRIGCATTLFDAFFKKRLPCLSLRNQKMIGFARFCSYGKRFPPTERGNDAMGVNRT
jgi:hypothetical protein